VLAVVEEKLPILTDGFELLPAAASSLKWTGM